MEEQAPATADAETANSDLLWTQLLELSCEITVELPLAGFTVRDLIQLAPQRVIDTKASINSDVPTLVNGTVLAWSEFEVVADSLAVRITDFV
ncbi:MAG TPA: FliM/FliN family flagellar motor C-terminal domain-containing protein [Terriglobales bacterium]|nr:FliM/FliN family flagellar motor C-terminal domain-containing protein [Terriglobales bacterium]